MGRGRAKAKQQKVARELKYNAHHTDLDALQRELRGSAAYSTETVEDDDEADPADEYDADYDEADGWADTGR
jgi:hypothetical protein